MGDRGNICMSMEDGNKIYFYTHWRGGQLKQILKSALKRGRDRWTDESYLARIIFSEMIKDDVLETTGYGISTYEVDNENPIIYINCLSQTIGVQGKTYTFSKFIGE